jgi:hypothetical protein
MFPTSVETEFTIERMAREASQLDAEDLRRVLIATWRVHAAEKLLLQSALEAEGIVMRLETRGLEPLALARKLREIP